MNRLMSMALVVVLCLPLFGAQDGPKGTLPPGPRGGPVEVVDALLVQAQVIHDDQIMFLVPMGNKVPSMVTRVDGKAVRAIGIDRKPLGMTELHKRLSGWTTVVIVRAELELPDPFFLKVLNERSVLFALPQRLFAPMAKAATTRRAPGDSAP
jgi:hypothetical protein